MWTGDVRLKRTRGTNGSLVRRNKGVSAGTPQGGGESSWGGERRGGAHTNEQGSWEMSMLFSESASPESASNTVPGIAGDRAVNQPASPPSRGNGQWSHVLVK